MTSITCMVSNGCIAVCECAFVRPVRPSNHPNIRIGVWRECGRARAARGCKRDFQGRYRANRYYTSRFFSTPDETSCEVATALFHLSPKAKFFGGFARPNSRFSTYFFQNVAQNMVSGALRPAEVREIISGHLTWDTTDLTVLHCTDLSRRSAPHRAQPHAKVPGTIHAQG
jgi:hypothetical protein